MFDAFFPEDDDLDGIPETDDKSLVWELFFYLIEDEVLWVQMETISNLLSMNEEDVEVVITDPMLKAMWRTKSE